MIAFAVEPLRLAQPDIEHLIPAQWAHTGDSDISCKPNWPLYHQFAERGALMVVMAREDDLPVGYLAAFIYPHPNAVDNRIASIPTYYVAERPARALIMSRMVDFAVQRLIERGVYKVEVETNAIASAGRLWELQGFKVAKIGYSLRLTKPPGVRYA